MTDQPQQDSRPSRQPVGWQRGIYAELKTIREQNDSILSIVTLLAASQGLQLDAATISSMNANRRRARIDAAKQRSLKG